MIDKDLVNDALTVNLFSPEYHFRMQRVADALQADLNQRFPNLHAMVKLMGFSGIYYSHCLDIERTIHFEGKIATVHTAFDLFMLNGMVDCTSWVAERVSQRVANVIADRMLSVR